MAIKLLSWDVESSNLLSLSFSYREEVTNPDKVGTLIVNFKGGSTYSYREVPLAVIYQVLESDSIGKTFNELIRKGKYKFNRIH